MNRKLHNTLLAASTTGLALVFGLLLAHPVAPPSPSAQSAAAARTIDHAPGLAAPTAGLAKIQARRAMAAVQATRRTSASARLDELAKSPADAASLIATLAAGAAIDAALAGLEAEIEATCASGTTPDERPVRRSRARDAFATPYFSFAHGMRDGTGA